MKVYTKLVIDLETGCHLYEEGFNYAGPLAECKGATKEERTLQAKQAEFYDIMRQSYEKQFAGQDAILNVLREAWAPVLAAGPGQKGFTSEQEAAFRTGATEGTAAEYKKALQVVKEGMVVRGGGTELLPSGTDEAILGDVAGRAAESQASKNIGITQANYERGYQRFVAASNALAGIGTIYNPVGLAGESTKAGASAFESAKTIQEQDRAAGGWAVAGGILGGAATSFAGGFGTELGKRAGH